VPRSAATLAFIALIAAAACNGSIGGGAPSASMTADGGNGAAVIPFQGDPPRVYVAKVKNVLVGLPPTDAEVKAVESDPTQLKALIKGWMALPEYQAKMLRFFELAFQQTQVSIVDFEDQAYPGQADFNTPTQPLLVQNATESFARTVLELIAEGQPLTAAMTTQRYMMTPALKELYVFLDQWQVDDAGKVTDAFKAANSTLSLTVEAAQGPIPISETLDPSSPNYMHWYNSDVGHAAVFLAEGCSQDPIVYPPPVSGLSMHYLLYGALPAWKTSTGVACPIHGGTAQTPQITGDDFTAWQMVSVRQPMGQEASTAAFYDLASLRSATALVLKVPRVGFFSTPAFFANWQTNTSNQMRVTMNQALIVATGAQVDGTDPTVPTSTPGLDTAHASQTACFRCHQTLDPTRSILSSTYSWNYHGQSDGNESGQPGLFAFEGVIKPLSSVYDLGATLAQHPLFAQAWAQKLCYYANSSACEPTDPEFQRVVGVFKSSGYSWSALVTELMASPLTTNATPTATRTATGPGEGVVVAVSRRDHLCAALNNRLGFADLCGLDAIVADVQSTVPEIVAGLPSDGYGRGATAPVLPNSPTLFYRAGTENICEAAAALVIDVATAKQVPNVKQWSSAQPGPAISDFVQTLMALPPSDPRAAPAQQLLQAHFTAAMQTGATATAALQSTFVTACLAPSSIAMGM
jgi:hypothetical protein